MGNGTVTQSHLQSANNLVHNGDNAKAVVEFDLAWKAQEIDPQNATAWNDWGVALYLLKRYDEAVEKLREAQRIDPRYFQAYSNMGAALAAQQKTDQAIGCYRRATEINPNYSQAYFNWGNLLYRAKKYAEAAEQYRGAVKNTGHCFLACR